MNMINPFTHKINAGLLGRAMLYDALDESDFRFEISELKIIDILEIIKEIEE